MSTNDADRLITAWLESVAPAREPEHLLADVLERTTRTRRRPAWRIPERWIPMTTLTAPVSTGARLRLPLVAAAVLLVVALLAGVAMLAGSRAPTLPAPYGPAANGLLAFESATGLVALNPATGDEQTLWDGPGLSLVPGYSPDGSKVTWFEAADEAAADAGRAQLYVANADGTDARPLATYERAVSATWSPDGAHLYVVDAPGETPRITVVPVDGSAPSPFPVSMAAEMPAPRPSDGGQVVFRGQAADGSWGLYLSDSTGQNAVHLDLDPTFQEDWTYRINSDYYFMDPTWSPDGRFLAYHTLEESEGSDPDPGFRIRVAAIGDDGTVISDLLVEPHVDIDDEFQAAWLNDGSALVVHRVDEDVHTLVRWPIAADGMSAGPVQELAMTVGPGVETEFRFVVAPDGTEAIAWTTGDPAWRVPLDGSVVSPALFAPAYNGASWQRVALP